jgi:hypothetical protein
MGLMLVTTRGSASAGAAPTPIATARLTAIPPRAGRSRRLRPGQVHMPLPSLIKDVIT